MADKAHDERSHSLRSPSKAPIYTNCLGAPRLWAKLIADSGSSYAARLGTAKHTLSEMIVTTGMGAEDFIGTSIEVEGERFDVDEDFARDVKCGVDMLMEVLGHA